MADDRDDRRQPAPKSATRESLGKNLPSRLESLLRHRPRHNRYVIAEEIGRGGMGEVLEVWDDDLRRRIAMKVVRRDVLERQRLRGALAPDAAVRLLDEAQITGQLSHPGVVPVHELGVDDQDRAFFTMQRVDGRAFDEIIELARDGREGWTMTRAVDTVLRVCETVGYAHAQGVVHRDLKPANVMVGEHGEVYVMDWGLAKVRGQSDPRDLTWDDDTLASIGGVQTDRTDSVHDTPDSPLVTRDGTVIGTPSYMPPEQAFGKLDAVGPASDVYSVGAMLYHLLVGSPPYVPLGMRVTPQWVLSLVSRGAPSPVTELAPEAVPELAAVCEKAMSREPADRYASMKAMALDLRNYLEGRVVRAHRTGAWAELKKWVLRNRLAAGLSIGLIVVLLVSGSWIVASDRRRVALVQRQLDQQLAASLVRRAALLADEPIRPATLAAYQRWLDDAARVVPKGAQFFEALAELRRRALNPQGNAREQPFELRNLRNRHRVLGETLQLRLRSLTAAELGEAQRHKYRDDVEVLEREIGKLGVQIGRAEADHAADREWRFASEEWDREHRRLVALTAHFESLTRSDLGWIARVEARVAQVEELSRARDQSAEAWREAIASIQNPEQCPLYSGMGPLRPQLGLVPLGRDPRSGLWEFWHVLSGERPPGSPGAWVLRPETGLVFVLVPGGSFTMGASAAGALDPDPNAQPSEGPPHTVRIDAYFLSKYEVTQEQWFRLAGTWPSSWFVGGSYGGDPTISPVHPVDFVSWQECDRLLERWSLRLPTEAEWEKAARGGTTTPYYRGTTWAEVRREVNSGPPAGQDADGYAGTAPSRRGDRQSLRHAPHARQRERVVPRLVRRLDRLPRQRRRASRRPRTPRPRAFRQQDLARGQLRVVASSPPCHGAMAAASRGEVGVDGRAAGAFNHP